MDYLDFDLELRAGPENTLTVSARSAAGEPREKFEFPVTEAQLENAVLKAQQALLAAASHRRLALSREEESVKHLGELLFKALLPGEVRASYARCRDLARAEGKGMRVRLRIAGPRFAALPWEFLYDPSRKEFVALSTHTPLVRYWDMPEPPRPLALTPPFRIWGYIAHPNDPTLAVLDVDGEKARLEQAIHAARERGLIQLDWIVNGTWSDLRKALRRAAGTAPYHVFHFIGHGGFDERRDEGYLILPDEQGRRYDLRATELSRLLGHPALRLAVLNACDGARGSERDVLSSTASVLVQGGLPAALAMQYPISDRAALELAREFYDALTDNLSVDQALTETRKALSIRLAPSAEWATPGLYLRAPNGRLFDMKAVVGITGDGERGSRGDREQGGKGEMVEAQRGREAEEKVAPLLRIEPIPTPQSTISNQPSTIALPLAAGLTLDLIRIPAGKFLMGSDKAKDKDARNNEPPQHTLDLPDYWIGKTPVTVALFTAVVQATKYECEKDALRDVKKFSNHPVNYVSWRDALAFCLWASDVTKWAITLPNEAEWAKAARGVDGRIYPWGEQWNNTKANVERRFDGTTPVGQFSPQGDSPYGCVDMSGNVCEWTRSLWGGKDPYSEKQAERENLKAGDDQGRVLRGGRGPTFPVRSALPTATILIRLIVTTTSG